MLGAHALRRWCGGAIATRTCRTCKRATGREIGWALLIALPALALPFVIRAAVVEGVATATEVSTIGIVYSVIAGLLIYRQFDWRRLMPMLVETASLSGAILLIIGAATGMAWALTQSGFSRDARRGDDGAAGRRGELPRRLDRRLHRARQRARGHPGDRAVRPAAVPDRASRSACTRCTMRWW